MPYPSEHAARLRDPGLFRRVRSSPFPPDAPVAGLRVLWGPLKSTGKVAVQAFRFHVDQWTATRAKVWLKSHGYQPKTFEAASGAPVKGAAAAERAERLSLLVAADDAAGEYAVWGGAGPPAATVLHLLATAPAAAAATAALRLAGAPASLRTAAGLPVAGLPPPADPAWVTGAATTGTAAEGPLVLVDRGRWTGGPAGLRLRGGLLAGAYDIEVVEERLHLRARPAVAAAPAELRDLVLPAEHQVRLVAGAAMPTPPPLAAATPTDDDGWERMVYGVVLEPDAGDVNGNILTAAEVRGAAHWYAEHGRQTGEQHRLLPPGVWRVVESYVAPTDFTVNGQAVKRGSWVVAARVLDDDVWGRIKRGDLSAFSPGGVALKVPVAAGRPGAVTASE